MIIFITTITASAHSATGAIAPMMGAVTFTVPEGAAPHINAGRGLISEVGLSLLLGALLELNKFETSFIAFYAGVLGLTSILSGWMLARVQNVYLGAPFVTIEFTSFLNTASLIVVGFCAAPAAPVYRTFIPERSAFTRLCSSIFPKSARIKEFSSLPSPKIILPMLFRLFRILHGSRRQIPMRL